MGRMLNSIGPLLGLLMVIGLFSLSSEVRPFFLTGANFKIILIQSVIVAIGALGMTMIIGIVTEVAIFYFTEFDDVLRSGCPVRRALIEAGQNRLRPIAMTTLAAILTLLPLAFAIGQGSAMQQPLAIAIISGLVVQLPLVLLVMPSVYLVFEKGHRL